MKKLMKLAAQKLVVCLGVAFTGALHAAWPADQPIKLIVPQAPGGTNDTVARIVAVELGKILGQSVVIDNKPGAAGAIGMQAVVQAKPDGYTLGLASDSSALLDTMGPVRAWKFKQSVQGVGMIGDQPISVSVSAKSPYQSLADVVKAAKERPGEVAYGTSGVGSSQHVVGEWLAKLAQAKLIHVPYKGGGQAITDLVSGQVPVAVLGLAPMLAQEKAGKVRIVAVTTPQRDPSVPKVPTLSELGFSQIAMAQWAGIVAPSSTPAQTVKRLSDAMQQVLALPAVKQQLADAGVQAVPMDNVRFSEFLRANVDTWAALVPTLNLKLD